MTVRPLQSAWRFSRNELSGKPGAVHETIFDGITARTANDRDIPGRLLRSCGDKRRPNEYHVNFPADKIVENLTGLPVAGVPAEVDDDALTRDVAEIPKTSNETITPSRLGLFVRVSEISDGRDAPCLLRCRGRR